jgi:hypothetical protein
MGPARDLRFEIKYKDPVGSKVWHFLIPHLQRASNVDRPRERLL